MSSRILFLGTGGDYFTVGKQLLGSGGIIVESDNVKLHIDPGPGTLNRARVANINLRDLTAIIVTHNHLGHSNDVNAVIDAMTHNGLDKKGVLIATSSVITGSENEHAIVTEYHKKCVERIITLEPGKKIEIEDVEILATPAEHTDPTTIGLKISTPEFTMGYTSDTAYTTEVVNAYKECDIIIINMPHPKGTSKEDKKKGLSSDDAAEMIKKINPRLAIITHFGLKMVKSDPLMEAREIQQKTGVQTIAAKEGMQVNPGSYAAKSPQKKLSSYKNS